MKKYFFRNAILLFFFFCSMLSVAVASKPLWTFTPQTPTNITVATNESATISYLITNQSSKSKNLIMKPIAGVTQSAPCQLAPHGTCTLTLHVNGAAMKGDVKGGPILCEKGNNLQCYQPSVEDILRIHLNTNPIQYTVIPNAGANGSISPSTPQVVNAGSTLVFTATPDASYGINQWLLDSIVVQNGGTTYQLSNIQANHTVDVTFAQTTLSAQTNSLALSINNPSDAALTGTPRVIVITNTGSFAASNVQVNASAFPTGTSISSNTCTGSLAPSATCNITITPGATATSDGTNACTASPGTAPVPTVVTVSASNATSININVVVLGYGCIYSDGYLYAVDDTTPNTQSISGGVAALSSDFTSWSDLANVTGATSTTNGMSNTNALSSSSPNYPAAEACINKTDGGFTNWYLPAICELGRQGGGTDYGCGNTLPNLYTNLFLNNVGNLGTSTYWSSTQDPLISPSDFALYENVGGDFQSVDFKSTDYFVRCVRAF